MGHYTGPKARINRRLGLEVYDSSGAMRAGRRRMTPPGQISQRRRRPTDYAKALREKQKIRHYYGLSQRQLRRFFALAKKLKGNKGENLLVFCERRLDNIVWRSGLARTRAQARQSVAHGHFFVNDRRLDVPSHIVRAGDTVQVRQRENLQKLYASRVEEVDRPHADFLAVEPKDLLVKVVRLPEADDVSLPVNINLVVELLSR
ncbi:MAG: 30S ribosomal protein S4 [Planctomycetota bacterium]|nr:30S ribosomal protein S4 [Planctomycetota bacterium]